jgi:hypothetical protein
MFPFCPDGFPDSPSLVALLFIIGLGEIGLGGGMPFGFGPDICSKCERRDETGFCEQSH